jgi:hypothetical protein
MERLYREDDWVTLAPERSGFLAIRSNQVPYVVFDNEDDVTTSKIDILAARLGSVLSTLWELRSVNR